MSAGRGARCQLEVPRDLLPHVVGWRQTAIEAVRENTGAVVRVDDKREPCLIEVSGEQMAVDAAMDMLRRRASVQRSRVEVPDHVLRHVVGPEGAGMREIEVETGASLRVHPTARRRPSLAAFAIEALGEKKQVEGAEALLRECSAAELVTLPREGLDKLLSENRWRLDAIQVRTGAAVHADIQGQLKRKHDHQHGPGAVAADCDACHVELYGPPPARAAARQKIEAFLAESKFICATPDSTGLPPQSSLGGATCGDRSRPASRVAPAWCNEAGGRCAGVSAEAGVAAAGGAASSSRPARCRSSSPPGHPCSLVSPSVPFPWSFTATLRSGGSVPGLASGGSLEKRRRGQAPQEAQDKENLAPARELAEAQQASGSRLHTQLLDDKSKLTLDLPDMLPVLPAEHLPFPWTVPLQLDSPRGRAVGFARKLTDVGQGLPASPSSELDLARSPPRKALRVCSRPSDSSLQADARRHALEVHGGPDALAMKALPRSVGTAGLAGAREPVSGEFRPTATQTLMDRGQGEVQGMVTKEPFRQATSKAEEVRVAIERSRRASAALSLEVQRQLDAMARPLSRSASTSSSLRVAGACSLSPPRSLMRKVATPALAAPRQTTPSGCQPALPALFAPCAGDLAAGPRPQRWELPPASRPARHPRSRSRSPKRGIRV